MSLTLNLLLASRSWCVNPMLNHEMTCDMCLTTQHFVTQVALCLPSVITQVTAEALGMAVCSTTHHTHKLTLVTCSWRFTITSSLWSINTPYATCRHDRKHC